MNPISYYPCGTYYMPSETALVETTINTVVVSFKGNSANVAYFSKNDQEITIKTPLYQSTECFKVDKPVTMNSLTGEVIAGLIHPNCVFDDKTDEWCGWVISDGIVKCRYFEPVQIKKVGNTTTIDCDNKVGEMFKSRQDAIDNGTIQVQHEDGSIETVVGWKKRLALTDKQQVLVTQIQELFEEFEEAGGKIICVTDEYKLIAINSRGVDKYEGVDRNHSLEDFDFELSLSNNYNGAVLLVNYNEFDYVNSDLNLIGKFKK